ncbi:MAG: fibronectin type III domain-containing protein [Kouleothrix sp.]|jgi:glycosidase/fibronectin type 3 domain-containing protein|nr:fibronectin type III domain-containing protein [Kouleothrix sp.]
MYRHRSHRWFTLLALTGVLLSALALPGRTPAALAAGNPTSVTIAGSLQSEAGCAGDWDPACAATHLTYDANDDVWQASFTLPAGSYEYKAALNDGWTESYGLNGGGNNIPLNLATSTTVKFYYDNKSHWITDNQRSVIAVAPGSFQSELGCSGDWLADCLRSWLQDIDGDGIYTLDTTALPAGSYTGKVALNESWDVNYGQGGVPGGADIGFNVPVNNAKVSFSYDATTHVPSILAGHAPDNNVEWDGLRHDSRDTLYRTPGGAVPAGTPVTIRFRTFHNDVTAVKLRLYDLNANGQRIVPMAPAATNVSCYQIGLESETCDFWAATLPNDLPNNFWYRFIVTDGTKTAYYGDNTSALDGGLGAPTADPIDQSWALMVHTKNFRAPSWAKDAVIYQIFPDRFRNGRSDNDAKTGDVRYDDPVVRLPWGTLPEGYCRNYNGATPTSCPWRFGAPPNTPATQLETPRGRDYMGGDLKGVDQQLDYLKSLGINTLYFNPIFDAGSNHSYDTQDYYTIDPYFGTQKDWENLNKHADKLGIRIILDGVFNHMSSDSPFFDRYHHSPIVGACESAASPYRAWFHFRAPQGNEPSVCAPSTPGGTDTYYDGWFGFDSIPVLTKSNADLQKYFLTAPNSVSKYWLGAGAEGWRLDVMGDASFPNGYWETFRTVVKQKNQNALIIGELWQKDSTLLRFLRGDRADATMNYRLRDAVLGLLAPQNFDSKGFADSGYQIKPSQFAARLASIREDYSDATYYALMNLLDSHDTARLLWTLTPGADTTADKELNAGNLAAGKLRQRLAALIQFTVPGAPTVYYGDEVGMTGADDPDDRRTYPWADRGGNPDLSLLSHYRSLAALRRANSALTSGDFRVLLADDTNDTVAYGRKTTAQGLIVALNRSNQSRTLSIALAGYIPNGNLLKAIYGVGNSTGASYTVANGTLQITLAPLSGLVLTTGNTDLNPPSAPKQLAVTSEGNGSVGLSWQAASGAAGYNVYRSPLSGGGWVQANSSLLTATSFTDSGLDNARTYYYVVKAVDSKGNESSASNEVSALPHYTIGWANLQWPPTLTHTISTATRTANVYGQVYIDGITNQTGATNSLRAQLGYGPSGSNPAGNASWIWIDAGFNADQGNNDEFVASLLPEQAGSYDYAYRYSTTNGREWVYADLDGIGNGYSPAQAGKLTVNSSGDSTAPSVPGNLSKLSASPAGIELSWDAANDNVAVYGYEILRSNTPGGPYTTIALVTGGTTYNDTSVAEGATYSYVVRAIDTSFNRSGNSNEVTATAQLRTVTLVINLTVPASTDATGHGVYIAGFLDRLDGNLPQWNPGGVQLTRVDPTHWTITFTGKETTQIEYKYTLGAWDFVEKDNSCAEVANRQLTLSYGSSGTQTVSDTVINWRNVAPCGN